MSSAPRFVLVANPGCPRLQLFTEALARCGLSPPTVVSWESLLLGSARLEAVLQPCDCLRLESPGRDWSVEKLLLKSGAGPAEAEQLPGFLCEARVENLDFDQGRIWPTRQWYLGLCRALGGIGEQLEYAHEHFAMQSPSEILTLFDKPACRRRLHAHGVTVPPAIGQGTEWFPANLDDLLARLREHQWTRVFLKPSHGSSGVGVVALEFSGERVKATTSTEMDVSGGQLRLYSSRRMSVYRTWTEVRRLIDALCPERLHVERWWPKASYEGGPCDLRVVTVAGRAWGGVARIGKGPITNLHLLNRRASWEQWADHAGASARDMAMTLAENAMACFPGTLAGGVDIAFSQGWNHCAVLEANAWGDLLKGVSVDGHDCYEAQIQAVLAKRKAAGR